MYASKQHDGDWNCVQNKEKKLFIVVIVSKENNRK